MRHPGGLSTATGGGIKEPHRLKYAAGQERWKSCVCAPRPKRTWRKLMLRWGDCQRGIAMSGKTNLDRCHDGHRYWREFVPPIGGGYIDARPQSRQIDETSCDARPDHTYGSFAIDRWALKIASCPQCTESDGWPSQRRPPRWATRRHMRCSKRALVVRAPRHR